MSGALVRIRRILLLGGRVHKKNVIFLFSLGREGVFWNTNGFPSGSHHDVNSIDRALRAARRRDCREGCPGEEGGREGQGTARNAQRVGGRVDVVEFCQKHSLPNRLCDFAVLAWLGGRAVRGEQGVRTAILETVSI